METAQPTQDEKNHPASTAPIVEAAAGCLLAELQEFIRQATPQRIADFVSRRFTEENAKREPMEKRIATIMDWQARGGFEVMETIEDLPSYIETRARHPFTDEYFRLAVETDEGPEPRYAAIRLGRAPMPVVSAPSDDMTVAGEIASYAQKLARADLFSGTILVARNGSVLAEEAFGQANRDFKVLNTIDTRFNVASLTKSWTALAICQFIEAGRLSFEDKVSQFINYPDAQAAESIRIKHLLSHTSGLGDYFIPEFDSKSRRDVRTIDDYLAICQEYKPSFAAGEQWKYSNVGMVLLGKIIETLSGTDYFTHVEKFILARTDMKEAGFFELDYVNERVAVGYHKTWTTRGARIYNNLFEGAVRGCPAGCAYATARDIFNFSQAFLSGRLVSPEMAQLMTTPKPELNSPDYGYGFAIHPEEVIVGHSGGLIGASSNLDMIRDPDGWVVVVLCNDLSMRAPVLKARQLVGVTVPEAEEGRSYLPRAGLSAR